MIKLHPFTLSKEADILQFAESHPWKPRWSKDHILEFIRQLTSNPDLVFDLFSENKRIATAVLIDKIKNKGNNACLEILGVDQHYDLSQIYSLVIQTAKSRLPRERSGIEITIHSSLSITLEDFTPYYELFEMVGETKPFKTENIEELSPADFVECYKVVEESFSENPDIATPGYEAWKRTNSKAFVYKDAGKIIGYLNLSLNGEIKSVGVLPQQRGKGIGRRLISYALNYLFCRQIPHCLLTVATRNLSALHLYQNLGFTVTDHYQVFQWKRK